MKVLKKEMEKCIGCGSCMSACAMLWHKEDNIEKSCIRVKRDFDDKGEIEGITVCSQCGECMPVCPGVALERDKNGIVRLDKSKCVGCFICVGYCPELAMVMHPDSLTPFKCVACGQCAKVCPTGAIYLGTEGE